MVKDYPSTCACRCPGWPRGSKSLPELMPLRALIVDDEPVARQRLKRFLRKASDVTIVAECADADAAIAAIQKHELDLVFLDVQMPKISGFEVVRVIGSERMPAVIFVTAFDRFALQA